MSISFSNYAFDIDCLEKAIAILSSGLSCDFEEHHSLYKGNYSLYKSEGKRIEVLRNLDPMWDPNVDEENEKYLNEAYKDCNILIDVSGETVWVENIQSQLIKIVSVSHIKTRVSNNEIT